MFENIEYLEDAKALVKNERSLQAIARLEKLKKRLEQYGVAERRNCTKKEENAHK